MKWQIDPAHTSINFSARHMMVAKVRGQFEEFSADIDFDPKDLEATEVVAKIDVASINTREKDRDAHLRSADFFNADEYPTMIFRSTKVEKISGNKGKLTGELTIKDITREVTLDVQYSGILENPWGKKQAGFSATGKVNRKQWDLNWNVALEAGGWLVGDEITIDIDAELVRAEAEKEAAVAG
jgi:polyisoprenoid-binding protein YceI